METLLTVEGVVSVFLQLAVSRMTAVKSNNEFFVI